MKHFTCPRCKQDTIPLKDKYLAGLWKSIYCGQCGARLCALPLVLALMYFAYTWALFWFIAIAYFNQTPATLLWLLPTWLVLDFINVSYIPLVSMRQEN